MKPTKKQYKIILKEAIKMHKRDEKIDKLLTNVFNYLSPSSYVPIIEGGAVSIFCETLEIIFPKQNISENVSYWLYEVPSMAKGGRVECTDKEGKHYDARNINEYIDFLLAI